MQVRDKSLALVLILFLSFWYPLNQASANNLDDAIKAYESEDYKKAVKILNEETEINPSDIEAYKWLGKSYEALFEVEKSMKSYSIYDNLKKNKASSMPSATPSVIFAVKTSPKPNKIVPSPKPKASIKPKSAKTIPIIKPKPVLISVFDGWTSVKVVDVKKGKTIRLIPKNSVDLTEVSEKSTKSTNFVIITCKIHYKKGIIINTNSDQITVLDKKNKSYRLYAMSTFKFQYGGNNASKKTEALQVGDYFELSKKDSRDTINFVFKVDEGIKLDSLNIMGYKSISLSSFGL
ncbi:MAG: hypothetical protein H7263_05345 [Candidatus Sericytochromatia bacterium]|nr:hypothetical protein [Candidatus Sericytochromatia bacterium]